MERPVIDWDAYESATRPYIEWELHPTRGNFWPVSTVPLAHIPGRVPQDNWVAGLMLFQGAKLRYDYALRNYVIDRPDWVGGKTSVDDPGETEDCCTLCPKMPRAIHFHITCARHCKKVQEHYGFEHDVEKQLTKPFDDGKQPSPTSIKIPMPTMHIVDEDGLFLYLPVVTESNAEGASSSLDAESNAARASSSSPDARTAASSSRVRPSRPPPLLPKPCPQHGFNHQKESCSLCKQWVEGMDHYRAQMKPYSEEF